jgi:DNA-damage-inducible protein J
MRTVVRARIDQATKDEAAAILDTIGLTVSDAFRMMMRRIVAERRLPFDPLVPNATTIAAIEASRRGELETAGSIDEVFERLDHDDAAE